jgi:hypothetical protein
MQYLVCESNDLVIHSGSPSCSEWVALTAPAMEPEPATMAMAFGAGFAIALPVWLAILSVRLVKKPLK